MTRAIVRSFRGGRSMVPYSAALRFARMYPRTRMAIRGAQAIHRSYQYLGRAGRAARTIGRAYRRYKGRKGRARGVGHPVGQSTAKRDVNASLATSSDVLRPDRVLYEQVLTYPIVGSGISDRERRMINLRGFKFCIEFKLAPRFELPNGSLRNNSVYFNWAVVSSKKEPTGDGPANANNHFFRGVAGNRAEDFDALQRSIDLKCRAINTDEWNVHMRKSFKINGASVGGSSLSRTIEAWLPIKRQIRFNDENEPSAKLYMCYWAAVDGANTSTSFDEVYKIQWHVTTYFREPCAC